MSYSLVSCVICKLYRIDYLDWERERAIFLLLFTSLHKGGAVAW